MTNRKLGALEVSELGAGCMSISANYGPAADKSQGIANHPRRARQRSHVLRHRRGLRPLHERNPCRRSTCAHPRPSRDRQQVRLRRRGFGRAAESARPHQEGGRGVAHAAADRPHRPLLPAPGRPERPDRRRRRCSQRPGRTRARCCTSVSPKRVLGRSAVRTPCYPWLRSRPNTRCGNASPNATASWTRAKNWASGSSPGVHSARAT